MLAEERGAVTNLVSIVLNKNHCFLCRVRTSYPMDRSRVCEECVCAECCSWQVGLWYHPVGDLLWWRSPAERQETHGGMSRTQPLLLMVTHTGRIITNGMKMSFTSAHTSHTPHHPSLPCFCPLTHQICLYARSHSRVCFSLLSRRRGFMKQSAN